MSLRDIWRDNLRGGVAATERRVRRVLGYMHPTLDAPTPGEHQVLPDGMSHELTRECWCRPLVQYVESQRRGVLERTQLHNLVNGLTHRLKEGVPRK